MKKPIKNEHLIIVKSLSTTESIFINSLEEAERFFIKILEENNYTMNEIAKFFGIKQRAMYYKKEKLGI